MELDVLVFPYQASILYKSIAGRYRPVRVADGPIMARYRFIKNAYGVSASVLLVPQLSNLSWTKSLVWSNYQI